MLDPILLVGGAGIVGREAAAMIRAAHPAVPFLIGGRDVEKARRAAAEIGNAEAVAIDLSLADLGIGPRGVSAVAVLFTDERASVLRFAQDRGVPHLSISPGIVEMGPEVAAFIHRPRASAIVLGTEWLVGATSVPTLEFAKAYARVDAISIGALLDTDDAFGPAANDDLERQTKTMPAALMRRDGAWVWRNGANAESVFTAIDGVEMNASALSPYDVLGLATATGARDVRFDLALGTSSSRRAAQPLSTEIIIELAGEGHDGRTRQSRHAVIHPGGQMPPTGLGVAMTLERLVGLGDRPPIEPGLYFPHQLLDPAEYLRRFASTGGRIMDLEIA